MSKLYKNCILGGTFAAVALFGLAVSYSAPYMQSGDEIVYLTGALQARDHNLPDAYMLQGDNYGPYLYPKLLLAWSDALGYVAFKSVFLVLLVFATGLGAYAMFRLLWLPWVPALLCAVVALMPRFAGGLEIFGTLTFRDAIGRQGALPLFFIATGFLIRRFTEGKSLWPVFGIIGLCVFLHPVTVMLFAFASLAALCAARLFAGAGVLRALGEVLVCGAVFVLGGAYLFVEVLSRLLVSASGSVSNALYIQAVLLRNVWDFPQGVLPWFVHMGIVSALFVAALLAFYALPRLRPIRAAYPMPHGAVVLVWGLAIAATALTVSVALPGLNLYFMEHAGAPYIFQQWSRIDKFYYLGLFVALAPAAYAMWHYYRQSSYRFKRGVLVLAVLAGLASSSFGFEVAQYALGYKNYDKAYIPQALSGAQDGVRPSQYAQACQALKELGALPQDEIISGDFAFRYYCKANLYVTNEEGGAYTQLTRADMVGWYERLEAQREAFKGADTARIAAFARKVGARFVILSNNPTYAPLKASGSKDVAVTDRFIVVRIR